MFNFKINTMILTLFALSLITINESAQTQLERAITTGHLVENAPEITPGISHSHLLPTFVKDRRYRSSLENGDDSFAEHSFPKIGEIINEIKPNERRLKLFVTTFNVNGKLPSKEDFPNWIPLKELHDLIVIGLQELFPIDKMKNYIFVPKTKKKWMNALSTYLEQYILVETKSLNGIFLAVFKRKNPLIATSHVIAGSVKTGLMNLIGNKGGVGISFKMDNDIQLCFINSHLAAGDDKLKKRNEDYHEIAKKLCFGALSYHNFQNRLTPDLIIWMGDLNYRLSGENLSYNDMTNANTTNVQYKDIFQKYDQLRRVIKAGEAFAGFNEMPVDFKPTYKYDPGSDKWDSKKMRMPAWCDRILHRKFNTKLTLKQINYNSAEDVNFSDHKPVYSEFTLAWKTT